MELRKTIPRGTSRLERIRSKRGIIYSPFQSVYSWTIDNEKSLRNHYFAAWSGRYHHQPTRETSNQTEFHDTLTLATQETSPWEQIKSSEAIITNQPEKLAIHDTLTLATQETWEQIKSSEAIQSFAQSYDRWVFWFYCRKYTSLDNQCWSDKKCSKPSDCHGDLKCSELLN